MSYLIGSFDEKRSMALFSRKKKEPVAEERSVRLGGLLFNTTSSYSNSYAMKLSAFFAGVNQISNSVALLPIDVVNYDSDERRPCNRPDLWKLLNLSPDTKYNHYNVFKMAIESVILTGNAYFYIERDSKLNVKALHYINSDYVTPLLEKDGSVKYLVTGFDKAVDQVNIIHLWQHIDETFNGISLLKYAHDVLMGSKNAEDTANKFYKGGAGLNGVLKVSAPLTNDQKVEIRESWKQAFSSEGNGVAVLPKGIDYQPVSVSPEDAQLLESREFTITEIARFLNISPIKLFQLDEVSYSSMESTQLYYLQDTILPYCKMIEEEFNRKLFKPSEVGKIGVSFNFTRAMQTNRKDQAEYYRTLLTNGILSLNEVRGELGFEKIDSIEGDTHWIQLSYASAKDIANGEYKKQNTDTALSNTKTDNKQ